jgi:hypothetical protein
MRTTILYPPLYRQTRTLSEFNERLASESSTINSSALMLEGEVVSDIPLVTEEIQTLSEDIIANDVPVNVSTAIILKEYPVPKGMKGKTGFLNGYFYLRNEIPWESNTTMNYSFTVDDTPLETINDKLPLYRHIATTSPNALFSSNSVIGVGGFLKRVNIPVKVPGNASKFNAVIANSSVPLSTTQVGAVSTTVFNYTGLLQTFTVPSNVTSIKVYLWGAGGRGPGANNGAVGGSGAFVSGELTVSPGQLLYIVIGDNPNEGTTNIIRGNGGGSATSGGGGFSAIFSTNITGLTTAVAVQSLICLAAGGGGGGANSVTNFGGGGGITTGGAGLGASAGQGGTQSAGGTPNGALLRGGNGVQAGGGGGGGGYYGGGGGTGGNPGSGGGGGSSFLGSLTNVISANGNRTTNAVVIAPPGGVAVMQSFYGLNALNGYSGSRGGVAIITQGIYPTFIGSEMKCIY